jgi:hypothetical protein
MIYGLHDRLDSHGVEVQIQVPNQASARSSGIRCLRSPNSGLSTGVVVGLIPIHGHNKDEAVVFCEIPIGAGPDLGVVIR